MTSRRAFFAAGLLAAASGTAVLGVWVGGADDVGRLERPLRPMAAAADSPRQVRLSGAAGERRVFRDVRLETAGGGTVRFTLSEPPGLEGPAPLLVVLAGFRTGREALELFAPHGRARIAAFGYPYSPARWEREPAWSRIPAARSAALRVPAQVAALRAWMEDRGLVDRDRTALLGFSFGAVFAPAVQRLAAERGGGYRAVGLAFGGAGLDRMVRRALDREPAWLAAAAGEAVAAAAAPLEPARHLPRLPGTFMLVHGTRDSRIPPASAERLTRLTPDPKRVVRIDAGHLHPGKRELLGRVADLFRGWLIEEGVLPEAG